MTSVTRQLAEVLSATTYADLPLETRQDTYRAILDWLGSVLAGAVEPPARLAQQLVVRFGASREATVFGAGRASAAAAALANGVASHILELDDIHKRSTVHGAAPIIPAALAVAEREHADGPAFMTAVAMGYEAALRIGEAVNPSHYRYWHPTGTVATFGAAVAAGSLLKLSVDQVLDALGSAGTQAAGLWEFNSDGSMSKHLHPGKAAFNGVLSADLARAGFTGARRILEGDRGFFRAFSTEHDPTRMTEGLGTMWKIGENGYKLHSCCGHAHSAIDVALELRSQQHWTSDDVMTRVAAIHVETYGPGYEIVKESTPRSAYQAKFSMAYCVAVALLEGQVGLDQFAPERFGPDGVREHALASLLRRTRVTVEEELTRKYPAAWPARVTLTLTSGVPSAGPPTRQPRWGPRSAAPALGCLSDRSVVCGASDFPRGHPENPVSTCELEEKLVAVVGSRIGRDTAEDALRAMRALEGCTDMAGLFRDLLPG